MPVREISLVTVATVMGQDPSLYRPPKSGQTGKAVIVAAPPAPLRGDFIGRAGQYAEWNVNGWIFRKIMDFAGCTIFDEFEGKIYFVGPTGLIGPMQTAELLQQALEFAIPDRSESPALALCEYAGYLSTIDPPSEDGTYRLELVVSGGYASYEWVDATTGVRRAARSRKAVRKSGG